VILHELAHTKVKNHSRKFWDELERVLPNSKKLNHELKNCRISK
jgi:predicted metal-dependent hydrolase